MFPKTTGGSYPAGVFPEEVENKSKGVGGGIRALIDDIKMSDSVLHDFGYDLASSFNDLMRDIMRENPFSLLFKKELDDSENYFDAFADRIKTSFDNLIADMLSSFLLQKFMDTISKHGRRRGSIKYSCRLPGVPSLVGQGPLVAQSYLGKPTWWVKEGLNS